MKKQVLSTFLLLLMPFYNCIAQSDYSGTCGNGLIWTYSETTKTLTISGAGDMYNYDRITKLAPWYNFRNDIQKVILESEVYSIGDYAFINMAITSIVIPNSVARIGKWAFFSSDLISVVIPNGIATLEESTFNGCDKLTQINLPNTLTTIGYKAFYRCRSLASIEIPDKVTSIGELAFWECHSLTSVTIPISVTSIGANAFDGEAEYTPNIQTIISYIVNPFEIAGRTSYDERSHYVGVFSRKTLSNAILYVPKGTVDKYKSTDYWSKFVFIEESDPTDIIQVSSDDLLISAQNGTITVRGEQNGLPLTVYTADGKILGSATMKDGQASISTNLQRGEIAIVKVGSKSVKIKM